MAATSPRTEQALGALRTLRSILAECTDVAERRMFGHRAFFVKGRMFACLYGRGLALKVPARRRAALLLQKHCRPFRPHGKRMAQWVEIRRGRGVDFRNDVESIVAAMRFVRRQGTLEARR